jgi:hypothetical protein
MVEHVILAAGEQHAEPDMNEGNNPRDAEEELHYGRKSIQGWSKGEAGAGELLVLSIEEING